MNLTGPYSAMACMERDTLAACLPTACASVSMESGCCSRTALSKAKFSSDNTRAMAVTDGNQTLGSSANYAQKRVLGAKMKARFGADLGGKHSALLGLAFKAILHRTIVASTWCQLDHNGFAIIGLLALLHPASYALRVHRLADSLHTSFPHSVALMQLCFTSLTVVSSQEDFHLQDGAHAGRTKNPRSKLRGIQCKTAKIPNIL